MSHPELLLADDERLFGAVVAVAALSSPDAIGRRWAVIVDIE